MLKKVGVILLSFWFFFCGGSITRIILVAIMERQLSIVFLVVGCFLSTKGQDAEWVINRYFNAIGGRPNWENVFSIHSKGIIAEHRNSLTELETFDTTHFEIYFKFPGKHSFKTVNRLGHAFIICFNNDTLWTKDDNGVTIQPKDHASYYKSAVIPDIAAIFLQDKTKIEYIGEDEVDGVTCHVLKVDRPGVQSGLYYFSKSTSYLVLIETINAITKGFTYFFDYRRVGQVVVPFREEIRRRETWDKDVWRIESVFLTSSVELNKYFDDSIFKP